MNPKLDISVIICTRNRSESLRETLECLSKADRISLSVEVLVVDNDSEDDTREVVEQFRQELSTRYLHETQPGKSYCINHALDVGGLGDIIVILDDDMSPQEDWFQALSNTCKRHPACDYFGGRILLYAPDLEIPEWMRHGMIRGVNLSVIDHGEEDLAIEDGAWPSENHMWVRSRVFEKGKRLEHIWLSSAELALWLQNQGRGGIWSGDAVALHRIPAELLPVERVRSRMARFGRNIPHIHRNHENAAPYERLRIHRPVVWFFVCVGLYFRSVTRYLSGLLIMNQGKRLERQLPAIKGMAHAKESLLIIAESNRVTGWLIKNHHRT